MIINENKYVKGNMNSNAVAKLKKIAQTLTISNPYISFHEIFCKFMIWKKIL